MFLGVTGASTLIADTGNDSWKNVSPAAQYDARRLQIIPADSDTEGYLAVEEGPMGAITINHCSAQRVCSPLVSFPALARADKSDFTLLIQEKGKLVNHPYLKYGLVVGAGLLGALEWSGLYEAMTKDCELPFVIYYMLGLPATVGAVLVLGPPAAAVSTFIYATYLLSKGPAYMVSTLSGYGKAIGTFVARGVYEVATSIPSYAVRLVKEHPVYDLGAWASFAVASYATYAYLNKSSTKAISFEKSYGGVIKTSVRMSDLLEAIRRKESQSF